MLVSCLNSSGIALVKVVGSGLNGNILVACISVD
jgi:hypothetical protein